MWVLNLYFNSKCHLLISKVPGVKQFPLDSQPKSAVIGYSQPCNIASQPISHEKFASRTCLGFAALRPTDPYFEIYWALICLLTINFLIYFCDVVCQGSVSICLILVK